MIIKINNATKRAAAVRVALCESLEGYQDLLKKAVEDKSREDIKEYKFKIKALTTFINEFFRGVR